jgi:hypothetical protein
MASLIKIPATQKSFYTPIQAEQNLNKINNVILPKYGKIIDKVSLMTGVPKEIITAFVFIESSGDQNASTNWATGLLQVGNSSASDALVFEKSSGRLGKEEDALVRKYLGSRYSNLEKLKPNQKTISKTFVTKQDLLDPTFNLLTGTILLGQLIDEFSQNGVPRLDKIVVIYNRGRFDKVSKQIAKSGKGIDEIINSIPKGTGDYVTKLLGKNSLLDSLV